MRPSTYIPCLAEVFEIGHYEIVQRSPRELLCAAPQLLIANLPRSSERVVMEISHAHR